MNEPRRAPRGLSRRNLDFPFDPASVPRAWMRDDLFLSLFMDALSLVFPDGERFFVDSVKPFAAKLEEVGEVSLCAPAARHESA